ncbi:hypothetical protein [Paraburkholderia ferrariae]|uniref:Uncharacterized protein n=1 Tax=Paraburkholderia ferrariae TaxID=386056 RepID=A0ABU9RMI3_9BURK
MKQLSLNPHQLKSTSLHDSRGGSGCVTIANIVQQPSHTHPNYSDSSASGGGMMEDLILEAQLPVTDALLARLVEKFPAVRWYELDEDVRDAYARRVALLHRELRPALGVGDLSELVAFYNAYYWALVFAKIYQARYGFDAGIEQEAFKVLEVAPADVDWPTVERVHQAALRP